MVMGNGVCVARPGPVVTEMSYNHVLYGILAVIFITYIHRVCYYSTVILKVTILIPV